MSTFKGFIIGSDDMEKYISESIEKWLDTQCRLDDEMLEEIISDCENIIYIFEERLTEYIEETVYSYIDNDKDLKPKEHKDAIQYRQG